MHKKELLKLDIQQIIPNKSQPRTYFDGISIEELAQSIKENGLIQPIIVRPVSNNKYEIVAGERRYRACQKAMLQTVDCIIEEYDDQHLAEVAIIENIQRENLTPIEEAMAYQRLIDTYQLTQVEVASKVGKKQSTIANKLRLLHLPQKVQDAIKERTITERHARALLSMTSPKKQLNMLDRIIKNDLNVRQTEEYIKCKKTPKVSKSTHHGISQHIKIAINTIKQAVSMIEKTGVSLNLDEQDHDEYYTMTIKIKK